MGINKFLGDFVDGSKIALRFQLERWKGTFSISRRPEISKLRKLIEDAKSFNRERNPVILNYLPIRRYEDDLRGELGYKRLH